MPPKAGRGKGKKRAVKYRTQKRKAEETDDLDVQEDTTESPTRERRGRKSKKDGPSKTPERSPEGSWSPQQSQDSQQHSPSPPPPRNRQPESSDDKDESASPALLAGKSKSKPEGLDSRSCGRANPR
ncbi:uncharacterized protein [Haliotis cracherodii]|uniref:uncharacterized protein n=1 Tax=Haliotis cracherodii TaxID=6455 RepID=UPI0039EC531E